jgi:succinylglutamic semialdehyde dehydrogenase
MKAKIPYTPQFNFSSLGNYIRGEFHPPHDPNGEWIDQSPACAGDAIARVKYSYLEIDSAVNAAQIAFKTWKKKTLSERGNFLAQYKEALKKREAQFIEIIAREIGKPTWEVKTEFMAMLNKIDITLNDSMKIIGDLAIPEIMPGVMGRNRYRPHGVMVVVGPFNFPAHLPNGHIVPALLTGNTVIFKPSEKAPMTGQLMAEAFHEAGFPPGVFNLLQGERETSRRLCVHEGVAGILFTGSYEVGTRLKQDTLLQSGKLLALEMGGKNATVVWEGSDLEFSVREVLTSAFMTAGQRCSSTSRVIIHDSIAEEFVSKLHAEAKNFKIGQPFEENFMGPLIDATSVDRYLKFQPIATRDGFEMIMRGKSLELPYGGHYVTPAIAFMKDGDVAKAKKSVFQQTELFAPLLAIQSATTIEQALGLANSTHYGLVTSVFTPSQKVFEAFYDDLECGLINWNRGTIGASSRLPFGGLKKSGNHQPTALTSTLYCTYPLASLECETQEISKKSPGLG